VTPSVFPPVGPLLRDVPAFVRGYAQVKQAAAEVNADLGVLPREIGAAISAAAAGLAAAPSHADFDAPVMQGGGGTETNLLLNAVLAERASTGLPTRIHPLDHVNRSQSTNDTYPTAQALATFWWSEPAVEALLSLAEAFDAQGRDSGDLFRLGRTCLQDAVPLTVRQTHQAQSDAVRRVAAGLRSAVADLLHVPLGGTAIGTGIGAPPGFAQLVVARLRAISGVGVAPSANPFDSLAHLDGYSAVAAACARVALVLGKIAQDLRVLGSGPVGGLGELTLPKLLPGSSIMPGKVNPVIPELVLQYGFRIRGAAHTIDLAVAAGELELNVMEPVILAESHQMLALVTEGARAFATCIAGLHWNEENVRRNLDASVGAAVEASVVRGYDSVAAERSRA
jgi:aspartate ammonia-lyase